MKGKPQRFSLEINSTSNFLFFAKRREVKKRSRNYKSNAVGAVISALVV